MEKIRTFDEALSELRNTIATNPECIEASLEIRLVDTIEQIVWVQDKFQIEEFSFNPNSGCFEY